MDNELTEYELALRARDGDGEALAELVERTRLRLFAQAYADLRHYEDAQDAVASSLIQVCLHVGELREPDRILAWMQSVLRNEVRRLRRRAQVPCAGLEDAEQPADVEEPSLLRIDIERALRRLPGSHALVIRLFYLEEISARDIARRLGRTEGTVTSWLHRGRRQLAGEMEGYATMARREQTVASDTKPAQSATIIHTDLESDLLQRITEALQSGGYATAVTTLRAVPSPDDLSRLSETVGETRLIVLDEWIGGHPAMEFLVNLRSAPETREIPISILCAEPSDFTVTAYFSAGVDRLVRKENAADVADIAQPHREPMHTLWTFTARARRVISFAIEEARRVGGPGVGTEHLLLGLVREENLGSGVLVHLGLSLKQIRGQVELQREDDPFYSIEPQLTARGKRVIGLAYAESLANKYPHPYIGAEHLLVGLLREGEGLAAKVLTQLGVSLERVREAIPVVGEQWIKVLEAEQRVEEARTAYHAFLAGA